MKNLLFPVLLFFVLGLAAQTTSQPANAGQPAYFIDGYHGGIYGHLPSWQTKFMVEKLAQYPDWKINLELEPESWDTIRMNDPESYAAFRKLFADQSSKGRIEYVNPNYGQSYLYNISGESVIRQFYYGMKKLRRHFPEAQFTTYSSEEPCFTSALPQILRSYGFSYASLKNPNTCWGGYTRAYGGELVNWIGPDGSSILTAPRYEVEALKPRSIWETIASSNSEEYVRKAFAYGIRHPVGMCLQDAGWNFGPWLRGANVVGAGGNSGGAGGGGGNSGGAGGNDGDSRGNGVYAPTIYTTWRGYFANISNGKADRDWRLSQEDVLVGLMWGAQVLQRIAREVRISENAIIRTEKLAALARVWKGSPWPDADFEAAWRTLLLSQHHDCWIVPYNGKEGDTWADKVVRWTGFTNAVSDSITQSVIRQLSRGRNRLSGDPARLPGESDRLSRGRDRLSGESDRLSGGVSLRTGDSGEYVRVFNTTAVPRNELVLFRDRLFRAKVPPMGYASYRLDALPSVNDGSVQSVNGGSSVPSGGALPSVNGRSVSPANGGSAPSVNGASVLRLDNGVYQVESDLYRIRIDPAKGGAITSWVAKQLGNKEFVEEGKRFNELRGNFYNAGGMRSSSDTAARIEILENGPAEVKVAIKGQIADNPFIQVLTVQQGQPRVDIHLTIDWKGNPAIGEYFDVPKNEEVRKAYYDDRFKLLALFPVRLSSQKIYKNAPFDVLESKLSNTFYNRWDSIKNNVLLNWVDVTDGAGKYGMALFCDHTTSYAHGVDFPLGLTVQYSGNGIFYRNYTIDGPSEINYALIPHAGRWDKAGIWMEGTKWSEPLIATAAADGGERSLLQTEKGVEISSLTVSGNALLVRVFNAEAKGPLLKLYIGFKAAAAAEIELDGRQLKLLPIHTDKKGRRWVELQVPQFGIRTIKFEYV